VTFHHNFQLLAVGNFKNKKEKYAIPAEIFFYQELQTATRAIRNGGVQKFCGSF
jgi:hypothetical protein